MTSRVRCSRSEHRPLWLKVDDVLPGGKTAPTPGTDRACCLSGSSASAGVEPRVLQAAATGLEAPPDIATVLYDYGIEGALPP